MTCHNRRIPTRRVFTRVYQAVRGSGAFRDVHVTAEREDNDVGEQENTVQMVERSPRASAEELQNVWMFPKREWRTLHAAGKHPASCSLCKISDLAIWLRGCNLGTGSVAVDSYIVTSCLLTKLN